MTPPSVEGGAVSTELAVVTPILIGFMLLALFAGRVAQAEGDVANAAQEAARAASLEGDPSAAVAAAEEAAASNLAASGLACVAIAVRVDTGAFRPGGRVGVTVGCVASFADLALLEVPGSRTFSASAVETIDQYRAGGDAAP